MSLNGLTGTYYDYLRVSSASFIVGSSWNKVLHDGVFVTDSSVLNGSVTTEPLHVLWLILKERKILNCIPKPNG
jgi:hypothetical protein